MNDRLKILKNIAILISGTGSNMEAIINDTLSNDHPGIVKFVLSNRSDALGLLKAKELGIKTFVLPDPAPANICKGPSVLVTANFC